jgi:hypothetical protein
VTSEEVLKQEERQRIMGIVPNFNTVESSAGVPSLSPKQKFHLMYKSSVDPLVFLADAFVAGLSQARNTNPGFGQGAEGYFKRFGRLISTLQMEISGATRSSPSFSKKTHVTSVLVPAPSPIASLLRSHHRLV